MDKEQGNKLIREFMNHGYLSVRYQYHLNWQYLMPVVEKIEIIDGYRYYVKIIQSCCFIHECNNSDKQIVFSISKKTKIEAVYDCVVDFITWYNKSNPN